MPRWIKQKWPPLSLVHSQHGQTRTLTQWKEQRMRPLLWSPGLGVGWEMTFSRLLSLFTFEFLESLACWLVLPGWVHSGIMLAESHQDDFSLFQQAKSGKYGSGYFCVTSSGTNINLRMVVRNSAWGSSVSTLACSDVSGPPLPFHPHLAGRGRVCVCARAWSTTPHREGGRGCLWSFPSSFKFTTCFSLLLHAHMYMHIHTHCYI